MSVDRTRAAEGGRYRPTSGLADARDRRRSPVHPALRLPVAHAAGPLPPRSTVRDGFRQLPDARLFEGLGHLLVLADRQRCGRQASPSAAVMDSQAARACKVGAPRDYNGAKLIVARKRHALVDADSRLPSVVVGAASVQDRDGVGPLARATRHCFPFVERIFAGRGYQGDRVRRTSPVLVEIVRPRPGRIGFAVQPRRWVSERTFVWLGRNQQLWKDAETTIASSTAILHAAAANVLLRRIASAE